MKVIVECGFICRAFAMAKKNEKEKRQSIFIVNEVIAKCP